MSKSIPSIIALAAGAAGISVAFLSSAGAQDQADTSSAKPLASAVFAGGCFWCVEADFDKVTGVMESISGYAGGHVAKPTYKQVTHGDTGHYEAVKITYDPDIVSYEELVHYFMRHIDPLDARGQFCDKGDSYRSAIFVGDDSERATVDAEFAADNMIFDGKVVTAVLDASTFWPAETYHQDYYTKNPIKYRYYRTACGRDKRVKALWGTRKAH